MGCWRSLYFLLERMFAVFSRVFNEAIIYHKRMSIYF